MYPRSGRYPGLDLHHSLLLNPVFPAVQPPLPHPPPAHLTVQHPLAQLPPPLAHLARSRQGVGGEVDQDLQDHVVQVHVAQPGQHVHTALAIGGLALVIRLATAGETATQPVRVLTGETATQTVRVLTGQTVTNNIKSLFVFPLTSIRTVWFALPSNH